MVSVQGYPTQKLFNQCCFAYRPQNFNSSTSPLCTLYPAYTAICIHKSKVKVGKEKCGRKCDMFSPPYFLLKRHTATKMKTKTKVPFSINHSVIIFCDSIIWCYYYFLTLLRKSYIFASKISKISINLKSRIALCVLLFSSTCYLGFL